MSMLTEERRILTPDRHDLTFDAAVTGMAFLNGGILAIACGDGGVQLVPPAGAPILVQAHENGAAALTLAVDVDGAGVLTGGDDGRLVRTSADGGFLTLLEAPGRQIDVIAVSGVCGLRAAAFGKDIRLIDRAGAVTGGTADHPTTVTGLAFNPRGKRLAASHYGGVTLWWTGTLGQSPKRLGWRGSHIGASWSPDGSIIMTATQEATLHGWRLTDGKDMQMTGYAAKVRSMDWLAKPMTLATAGGDCVTAWSFSGGGPMGKRPVEVGRGIGRLVTSVAVHPKRSLVAAGFDDGRVAVCELSGERVVRLRPGDGGRTSALAWSSDGTRLAAATDAGAVSLFDLSRGAA
jgi:WD40 repeat protein